MSGPTSIKTQSRELKARSVLYRALALFFRHPGKEHLKLLTGKMIQEWRDAVQILNEAGPNGLRKAFEAVAQSLETISLRQWTEEFERLFGHAAHGAIPPYELEYGEPHSHREPQELGDIAAFYQAFGLQRSENIRERVDHAAVECDFLNFLAFKEAYALEHHGEEKSGICREARRHFLRDHLGRWLPVFTTRLAKHAQGGLYGAVADLAFTFMAEECARLGIQPGPPDLPLRVMGTPREIACGACPIKELPIGSRGLNPGYPDAPTDADDPASV